MQKIRSNTRKRRKNRKKKEIKKEKLPKTAQYKIYVISYNRQIEFIGYYPTLSKATKAFNDIKEKNEKETVFPVKYLNIGRIKEAKYELIMTKRKGETESHITQLRNEYGKYVDYELDNDEWILFDKVPYYKEESFWVYGYHPRYHRKDFMFIYDEFIRKTCIDKYHLTSISILKNKVLFDNYDELNMVICKNKSDAIRMYNLIEEKSSEDKVKFIFFNGDCEATKIKKDNAIEKIRKLTNWNNKKILRSSTRP